MMNASTSSHNGGTPDTEFVVGRIVAKRFRFGNTEYLLKWKNYPDSENTWKPAKHLACQELLEEYENKVKKTKNSETEFDNGYEAEKILGVTTARGQLEFLIQWKGQKKFTLVKPAHANERIPLMVIEYYQQRLQFPKDE